MAPEIPNTPAGRPLHYWAAGSEILTTIEENGCKAVVRLNADQVEALLEAEEGDEAADLRAAIAAQDEFRRVVYAG